MQAEYNIGVVGCGKMGLNIFQYLAEYPFRLVLVCNTPEKAEKAGRDFSKRLNRSFKHGLINQDMFDFRLSSTIITNLAEELKECDLVIESVTENTSIKKELFIKLDKLLEKSCILASNSSSVSPDILVPSTERHKNTIGLHFFYPVGITDLVEVNTLESTSSETIAWISAFLGRINRFHIVFSGPANFSINRVLLKLQAGCCYLHRSYGIDYKYIDAIVMMELFPVGVFGFFDNVGIDTMLVSVKNYLSAMNPDSFYMPLVDELEFYNSQGKLGRKSGEGFYQYHYSTEAINQGDFDAKYDLSYDAIKGMMTGWYLDSVNELISKNICALSELLKIHQEYLHSETDLIELADRAGYQLSG